MLLKSICIQQPTALAVGAKAKELLMHLSAVAKELQRGIDAGLATHKAMLHSRLLNYRSTHVMTCYVILPSIPSVHGVVISTSILLQPALNAC
jgi:hypothetical protein